jgi:hypothetical protein
MKNFNLKLFFIVLVIIFFTTLNAFAQVGIGTTEFTPDPSSMLEIKSTTKGVLIPRMTTAQRTGISSPANGLLVFDITSNSFWYFSTAWTELSNDEITDADGDTKVEVEKTTDVDEINFTANGTEYMQIVGANGDIKLGNRAASTDTSGEQNYTKITADGSLSYVGNATRWDDLKVPVNSVKIKNVTQEGKWEEFKPGLVLLWFDNSDAVVFTVQMPHAWKEGTRIYPHVHWTIKDGALGTDTVTWTLDYSWQKIGAAFGAAQTVSGTATLNNYGADYGHILTELGTNGIDGSGMNLSSMLVCTLTRSAGTYGSAGLLEIDFHYQIDSDGSNEEYIKTN